MFMPSDKQIDQGFGVTGDAFKDAADKLAQENLKTGFVDSHLPISFLYRHSVELYLKSIIIVLHRSLNLTYGSKPADSEPFVLIKNKWTPMYRVHSVGDLFAYFKALVVNNQKVIAKKAKTDWSAIPLELEEAIAVINKADTGSTYFRYPITHDSDADKQKSSWKDASSTDIFRKIKSDEKPVKAFLMLNANDEIVNSYQHDQAPIQQLQGALKTAAELLSGAHAGLRVELAGGR